MKKVFLLLLLTAMLGGYQFLDMSTSKKANIAQSTPERSEQEELFQKNKDCSGFRESLLKNMRRQESISFLFYSPRTNSCLYEKRTRIDNGIEMQLIDIFSKTVLASWSSTDPDQEYREYLSALSQYQN
jgi:hypothetical protein